MDGVLMLVVEDADLPAGSIALYCWGNTDARFSNVRVFPTSLLLDDWLLDETFDTLNEAVWTMVDEGTEGGPWAWNSIGGLLQQTNNIHDGEADSPVKLGTYVQLMRPALLSLRANTV